MIDYEIGNKSYCSSMVAPALCDCGPEWTDTEFDVQPTTSFVVIDGGRESATESLDHSEHRPALQLVT